MRISDWSADVCSSDRTGQGRANGDIHSRSLPDSRIQHRPGSWLPSSARLRSMETASALARASEGQTIRRFLLRLISCTGSNGCSHGICQDRKSVGSGTRESERVDNGSGRIIKKTKEHGEDRRLKKT